MKKTNFNFDMDRFLDSVEEKLTVLSNTVTLGRTILGRTWKNIEAEKEYFEPLKETYAATMEVVSGIIGDIKDAETANMAAETIAGLEHALTSKQEALAMLTEKTNSLGLKYTKKDGYVLKGE